MKRFPWDPARWVFAALSMLAAVAAGGPAFAQVPPPIDLPQPVSFAGRIANPSDSVGRIANPSDLQEPPPPPVNPSQPCVPGAQGAPCVQPPPNGCVPTPLCEEKGFCGSLFDCKLGKSWTLKEELFEDKSPVNFGGWFQFGYHNRSTGVFNTHPHRLNLHQGYLFIERVADGSKGFDFGGRFDTYYGVDATSGQSFGNNPGRWDFQNGFDHGIYGWALPQLYGEAAWDKWNVKAGRFYTPVGYETVTATGNFFYSHSLTHNFSEPFGHTGVLVSYKASDKLTAVAGWTLGWDSGFDRFDDASNFIGGGTYAVTDKLTVIYYILVGDLGFIGEGATQHTVVSWKFADKWEYVLGSDIVHVNEPVFTGNGYDTFSLNNYLFYTVNDCWKLGGRAEWWKADGISYGVVTAGVNWKPMANLTIRPELRYQWSPAGDGDAGNPVDLPLKGAMFGIDAYITY